MTTQTNFQTFDSATITAQSKSNFSSSFFFLPPQKQLAMRRVYAFFRVIDDVVDEEPSPIKQKENLHYWKNELVKAYETKKSDIVVLNELIHTIESFNIPLDYFLKLIEGCEMDLITKKYQTFEQLYEYCYRVASMVGLVCLKIFEYHEESGIQMAIDLGIALQLTNIIRDVGCDLQKGRIYLPENELKQFGVNELDLQLERSTPEYLKLMDFQFQRALSYYEKSAPEFKKDTDHKLLAAQIMSEVYRQILFKIKELGYPNLNRKVKLSFFEKIRILFSLLIRSYLS